MKTSKTIFAALAFLFAIGAALATTPPTDFSQGKVVNACNSTAYNFTNATTCRVAIGGTVCRINPGTAQDAYENDGAGCELLYVQTP